MQESIKGYRIACLLAALLLAVPTAAFDRPPRQRAHELDLMSAVLNDGNLGRFLDRASSEGWRSPIIDSAWYLRESTPIDQRVASSAARRLGREALVAIDAQRDSIRGLEGATLLERVRSLLDLGDWFGQRRGYGNVLVQWRSRELAIGGLGRLVVDLDFPMEQLEIERKRLRGSLYPVEVRAAVLNHEAGASFFPNNIHSVEELERYWAAGSWHLIRFHTPRSAVPDDPLARNLLTQMGIDPDGPDPRTSFFRDEACPAPATKLNCWEYKQHRRIMGSVGWIDELEALMEFRRTVGSFPLKAAHPFKGLDEGYAAFRESWEKRKGVGVEQGRAGTAWYAYKQIQAGTFGAE